MSYKKMLEKLKSLPVDEQLLARGVNRFHDGKCGCVIGKVFPSIYGQNEGNSIGWIVRNGGIDGLEEEMKELGATFEELQEAQNENDCFRSQGGDSLDNRKARFDHMIGWLEAQVALEEETTFHGSL